MKLESPLPKKSISQKSIFPSFPREQSFENPGFGKAHLLGSWLSEKLASRESGFRKGNPQKASTRMSSFLEKAAPRLHDKLDLRKTHLSRSSLHEKPTFRKICFQRRQLWEKLVFGESSSRRDLLCKKQASRAVCSGTSSLSEKSKSSSPKANSWMSLVPDEPISAQARFLRGQLPEKLILEKSASGEARSTKSRLLKKKKNKQRTGRQALYTRNTLVETLAF